MLALLAGGHGAEGGHMLAAGQAAAGGSPGPMVSPEAVGTGSLAPVASP